MAANFMSVYIEVTLAWLRPDELKQGATKHLFCVTIGRRTK